jgi:uncharacterized DUF497 family protein
MELVFEWNENKAKENLRKHKVSFDEAKTIFGDSFVITFPDDFHSNEENRFISIGISINNRTLLVVHTEQDKAENVIIIRLISSRKATASEREIYEQGK